MSTQIGPLRVHVAGGTDRRGGGDGPAVLLCHGFGAPGTDLVPFAGELDAGANVRWFFPEAPLQSEWGGRAWWHIDMVRLQQLAMRGARREMALETPDGLLDARAKLEATIAELEKSHGVKRDQLVVGGFSQGAMITTEIALHADRPFAGLAVLSGTLLSAERWTEAVKATGPTLRAILTHGRADPLLPFEGAEALRALLEGAGAQVEWVPHNGQHEIPRVAVDRLGAFLRARLAARAAG